MAVVVLDVLADNCFEMSTTDDEYSIQTFTPDGADETLSEGVGPWCPDWRFDDPDPLGAKHLVEAGGELRVAIPDQELDGLGTLGKSIGLLACWITEAPVV